jgi:HD-GYP domain-containing protein (c-di-GMP phosphodiesterase class II)
MKMVVVSDGSSAARQVLDLVDGYVAYDEYHIANIEHDKRERVSAVLAVLSRCNQTIAGAFEKALRDVGLGSRPLVLCLSVEDKARLARSSPFKSAELVSVPTDRATLFKAIKKANPTIKLDASVPPTVARAAQQLSTTLSDAFGASEKVVETVTAVAQAAEMVSAAVTHGGLSAWMNSVSEHHSYTARHCMATAGYAAQWANILGFSKTDCERFTRAMLVHDVGKVVIPLAVLDKPSPLSTEERELIENHPAEGHALLLKAGETCPVALNVAMSHHELLDGSGYPNKLSGDQIIDVVRCATIIDVYSALVDARAYKRSMDPDEAFDVLVSMKGKLDQSLVNAFRPVVDTHKGTLRAAA